MKRMIFGSLLVVAALSLAGASDAEASCTSTQCTAKIKLFYQDQDYLYISLHDNLSPLGCTPVSRVYIRTSIQDPVFRVPEAAPL